MSANRQQYAAFYQTNNEMKQVTKTQVWSLIRIDLCGGVERRMRVNWPRQVSTPCSVAAAAAGQRAEEEGSTKRRHPLRKATGKG
jgi:hypothetical protein